MNREVCEHDVSTDIRCPECRRKYELNPQNKEQLSDPRDPEVIHKAVRDIRELRLYRETYRCPRCEVKLRNDQCPICGAKFEPVPQGRIVVRDEYGRIKPIEELLN